MKKALSFVALAAGMVLGCGSDMDYSEEGSELGTVEQALTWDFESIEREDGGSGHTTYYMYTIDVNGTVCGGANDYIVHLNRSGAYANRSKLRFSALGIAGAGCLLNLHGGKLDSRVYDDNHVWACAGKNSTDFCGGPSVVFPGLGLWQKP